MVGAISYDPIVHLEVLGWEMSIHSLGVVVGFCAGAVLMLPFARRRGIRDDQVYAVLFWAAVGAALGARVAYVINHLGEYDSPLDALRLWEGGLSLVGGITGAILFAYPKMRAEGLAFWQVMDAAAPGLALGIVIGRVGDLVVADHLGKRTDFFLGYECPEATTASPCLAPVGSAVHHTALYDLVSTAVLLGVLLWLARRPHYDGFLIFVFAAWYGAARIAEDFFRIDETHGTGLTGSQWASVAVVLGAVYVLLVVRRTPALSRLRSR